MMDESQKAEAVQHLGDGIKALIALKIDEAERKLSGKPFNHRESAAQILKRYKIFQAIDTISNALQINQRGQLLALPAEIVFQPSEASLLVDYFLAHENSQIQKAIAIAKTLVTAGLENSPELKALADL